MPKRLRQLALAVLSRLGYEITPVSPGAVLVSRADRRAARYAFEQDKAIMRHLLAAHVAAVLELYRVNCVIDVGANKGQYGRMLRAAGYRGHIVSFEPVPEAFAKLQRAAADDPRWSVHQLALGREDGTFTMNVVPGSLSSILPTTEFGSARYPRFEKATTQEVAVRRLDSVLDEVTADVAKPRLYLKLDTQGYDLEAFAGAGERITQFVGMQSEVALLKIYAGMPGMAKAIRTYRSAGFGITGMYPVSRQSATGRVLEFDCIMVRASAAPARRRKRGPAVEGGR